ncbi:MAG TPA: glycoside hydrolase family 5 protein [Polyangiaceae bacterium]|jgi:endoglucanase|nr:glycoside hydrolase family 5 protein [Polyangiaceae bacterium]
MVAAFAVSACIAVPSPESASAASAPAGQGQPIPPPKGRVAPVARYGQLSVKGAQLLDARGEPVVLRGQAFGWDNWWPQYYNASVVQWLRDDWCADVLRPAMGIEPGGAYLSNPEVSKRRMMTVVDAAIQAGVYVIIDWHAHKLHEKEAVEFFSEMAQRYGKHPHVIYEIYNEPEKDQTWPQVKAYATAVIAAIRRYDPDNLVIVGSPEWDQRIDLVQADPLQGQVNVLYSVHFYAATHGKWLRDRVQAAISAGIPVFVSESSGAEASGAGPNNFGEWKAWTDFMEANRVSYLDYSVSDKAGETISVLQPGADASGSWTESQLTDSGRYWRAWLRTHCQ